MMRRNAKAPIKIRYAVTESYRIIRQAQHRRTRDVNPLITPLAAREMVMACIETTL